MFRTTRKFGGEIRPNICYVGKSGQFKDGNKFKAHLTGKNISRGRMVGGEIFFQKEEETIEQVAGAGEGDGWNTDLDGGGRYWSTGFNKKEREKKR